MPSSSSKVVAQLDLSQWSGIYLGPKSSSPNNVYGLTVPEARGLLTLLNSYDWIVYVGYVFWRKLLIFTEDPDTQDHASSPPLGADPKERRTRLKPIHQGTMGSLRVILELNVRLTWELNVQILRDFFQTLLFSNQLDAVSLMLCCFKVDLNVSCTSSRRGEGSILPLTVAIQKRHMAMVRLLLAKGADPKLSHDFGQTALHSTVGTEDDAVELATLLLKAGATVGAGNRFGQTPLMLAVFKGHFDFCKLLLEHGAQVDQVDVGGRAPLHVAARRKDISLVELLVAKGAPINHSGPEGRTPLHQATIINSDDLFLCDTDDLCYATAVTVERLLELGADAGAVDAKGATPLHSACELSQVSNVKALLAKGADPNAADHTGKTPMDYASSELVKECLRTVAPPSK